MAIKAAVIIPIYREELTELEKISLTQVRKVLGHYPIIFVAPKGKNFPYINSNEMIAYCSSQFFKNVRSYSQLMMSPFFYKTFLNFDYILIYQLDAFVFYDALEYFCSLGYDYIGAPWPIYARRNFPDLRNVRIGNGGFSLRNVKSHYNLLIEHDDLVRNKMGIAEDDFFAYCGAKKDINFNVPPINIAAQFSAEYLMTHTLKNIGNKLPFGCHGWTKFSADFFSKIIAQFGYNVSQTVRMQMDNLDYRSLENRLLSFAVKKLNGRINHGQSLRRYLPSGKFASVRVVRSMPSMKILTQLISEDNFLSDKIFIDDSVNVFNGVGRENSQHLLITSDLNLERLLLSKLAEQNFIYGKHFVSFTQEYLNHCYRLFRNLGK